jgi:SAM-dependent methyltransferase
VKLQELNPPGTWCQHEAILDLLNASPRGRFLEVGCGRGEVTKLLLKRGLEGVAIDYSSEAIQEARNNLKTEVETGSIKLLQQDLLSKVLEGVQFDWVICLMVLEHQQDDLSFLNSLTKHLKPGGHLLLAVPGRKSQWGYEDEAAGHYRRYDRRDLQELLPRAGIEPLKVLSVGVPVSNILKNVSDFLVRRTLEKQIASQTKEQLTKQSGVMKVPYKTLFPSWARWILNPIVMWPLVKFQKLFYQTNLGLTVLVLGRKN